jgi:hypothetical protein
MKRVKTLPTLGWHRRCRDLPERDVREFWQGGFASVVGFFLSSPFLFFSSKKEKKGSELVMVGVWWLVSMFKSDRAEFVEVCVDDPIRRSGVLVEAHVDVTI